jgi:hypothetical protein
MRATSFKALLARDVETVRRPWRVLVGSCVVVLAFGVFLVGPASTKPTTTIGQTITSDGTFCGPTCWVVQTSVSSGSDYVVPPGRWVVTGWSMVGSAHGFGGGLGSIGLIVLRPTRSGSYTVVGESPVVSPVLGPNAFTLASPITVRGGDRVGRWGVGFNEVFLATSDDADAGDIGGVSSEYCGGPPPAPPCPPDPATGDTVTPQEHFTGLRVVVSATLARPGQAKR